MNGGGAAGGAPRHLVVLTGAGISRESGLATFRDGDGLWAGHRLEDVCTPAGFARDPAGVQAFYNARRAELLAPAIAPNAAHLALARLEAAWAGDFLLVTQNCDDLHERAGSRRVLHMHGEYLRSRCQDCGQVAACRGDLGAGSRCPGCGSVGRLRPHVVWFEEVPLGLPQIARALAACHLFVAVGTSGHVFPAAGFVEQARAAGADTLELNLAPSRVASRFAA